MNCNVHEKNLYLAAWSLNADQTTEIKKQTDTTGRVCLFVCWDAAAAPK